jgi:GTP cyclohydrolase I
VSSRPSLLQTFKSKIQQFMQIADVVNHSPKQESSPNYMKYQKQSRMLAINDIEEEKVCNNPFVPIKEQFKKQ